MMWKAGAGRRRRVVDGAAGRRALVMLFVSVFVLSSIFVPQQVQAHGGGPVRAIWDDAQGFYMVIESNENPAAGFLGGVVHVTMIPTATEGSNIRLRGLDINVSAVGPGGRTTGPVRAKWFNGPYEADLMVNKAGVWQIQIEVDDGRTVQRFEFPLDVAARSALTDLAIIGGLMLVPILGIAGMVHLRQVRRARRTSSPSATAAKNKRVPAET